MYLLSNLEQTAIHCKFVSEQVILLVIDLLAHVFNLKFDKK